VLSLLAPYSAALGGSGGGVSAPSTDPVYGGLEQMMKVLAAGSVGGQGGPAGGSSFSPGGDATGSYSSGDVLLPASPLLETRRGVTLQDAAMQSLLDIARQSGLMPGTRELSQISDSYRSPQQQASAYANKPGLAAPPGSSYHQQGLAIDAGWWSEHPGLASALSEAGWNRFSPSGEPWHWSYGVTG